MSFNGIMNTILICARSVISYVQNVLTRDAARDVHEIAQTSAANGDISTCLRAIDSAADSVTLAHASECAATNGHRELCDALIARDIMVAGSCVLKGAAKRGDCEWCFLVIEAARNSTQWQLTNAPLRRCFFEDALIGAVIGDDVEVFNLIRDWCVYDTNLEPIYKDAFILAASRGSEQLCRMMWDWSTEDGRALSVEDAMVAAVHRKHEELLNTLSTWGPYNLRDVAARTPGFHDPLIPCEIMHRFLQKKSRRECIEGIESMMRCVVYSKNLQLFAIMLEWFADAHGRALTIEELREWFALASARGSRDICEFLRAFEREECAV